MKKLLTICFALVLHPAVRAQHQHYQNHTKLAAGETVRPNAAAVGWPDSVSDAVAIGRGIHPAISIDDAGNVHVVFGRGQAFFYTASTDSGQTFSSPTQLDSLPGLHLGASRGPQIAANEQYVIITALDKPGNVWAYSLDRKTGIWAKRRRVNDVPEVAKEGFVSLATAADGAVHAIWLDLRTDGNNKIVGAASADGGRTWSANRVLYQSPDGTVCECCQPTVVGNGRHVAVLFRNYVAGARDMYLLLSHNNGETFEPARKVGDGTWPLKACPMDGGGVFINQTGTVSTIWRREGDLYASAGNGAETLLGPGKLGKVAVSPSGIHYVWQTDGQIWAKTPGQPKPRLLGAGGYAKLCLLPNGRVLCVWEQGNRVVRRFIE